MTRYPFITHETLRDLNSDDEAEQIFGGLFNALQVWTIANRDAGVLTEADLMRVIDINEYLIRGREDQSVVAGVFREGSRQYSALLEKGDLPDPIEDTGDHNLIETVKVASRAQDAAAILNAETTEEALQALRG